MYADKSCRCNISDIILHKLYVHHVWRTAFVKSVVKRSISVSLLQDNLTKESFLRNTEICIRENSKVTKKILVG